MRTKAKLSLNNLGLVLCCSIFLRASPSGIVRGRVSDSEGAAIRGAHLLFHSDRSGRAIPAKRVDIMGEADEVGRFEIQLEPGFYDVCTMATAFTPECSKVLVQKQSVVEHNVHLEASPLVVKHLGDTF
jgi:hypothetical protein